MANQIPTFNQLISDAVSQFESALGQTVPTFERAFFRVMAKLQATYAAGLYRYGRDRALQNFAVTASRDGLIVIGREFGLTPTDAVAATVSVQFGCADGTTYTTDIPFIADDTGIRYFLASDVTVSGTSATLSVTADETGPEGNLSAGQIMSLGTPVPGSDSTGEVAETTTTGTEAEGTEDFRVRVLDKIRGRTGGANMADYREWAQEVAGCRRAYPYAGSPVGSGITPLPGMRTVYVEATTDIDPDGIAPASLIDQVRDNIITNPDTGKRRETLGLIQSYLYVESIRVTDIYIEVRNLSVDSSVEADLKSDIEDAIRSYFANVRPFIEGLDPSFEKRDVITDLVVAAQVDDVLAAYRAFATGVGFGLAMASFLDQYQLAQGERVRLGGITYV
ncbi:hypothetical protein GWN42_31335 [candidate division KSB1 bacterium]|nr:hypothetical protein [Phycisphaerae bacterium]NIQ92553.1 hypothetical protein [Deltaproteobacteria bacterium]NIV97163.1 hypothetical protein [candidate division KSB1 bacterium]